MKKEIYELMQKISERLKKEYRAERVILTWNIFGIYVRRFQDIILQEDILPLEL